MSETSAKMLTSAELLGNIDVVEVLRLGVIGFGFLLAFLAYRLLRKEQERDPVRHSMIWAAFTYMLFSLLLTGLVAYDRHLKDSTPSALVLQTQVDRQVRSELRDRLDRYRSTVWSYTSSSYFFNCTAGGKPIGDQLDCRIYGTCGRNEANTTICKGKYYHLLDITDEPSK